MSKVALLFCVAMAMPPGKGGGKMNPANMASRPLPDNELKQGTVSVLVRKGKIGAEGVEVWMLPAGAAVAGTPNTDGALTGAKTDANGRVYLKAANHVGRQVVVWTKLATGYQRSVPFQIPTMGGIRLLFIEGGAAPHGSGKSTPSKPPRAADGHHGHNHGGGQAMPTGPLTNDPSNLRLWISFRIMAIENEKVFLALTYSIINRGRETYHAGEHGLLLPMPEGAKGVAVPRGTRGSNVVKGKLMTLRPVPPGRHGLRVQASCNLPYDEAVEKLRLRSHLPIIGYSVSLKKYRTVRISGVGLSKPETFKHGDADTPWLVYRAEKSGFPRNSVRFGITGLPVRSKIGVYLFGGLALLLVLAAFGLTVARGRRRKISTGGPESATDHLVRIERDRLLGLIDDAKAKEHAAAVLAAAPSRPKSDKKSKQKKK